VGYLVSTQILYPAQAPPSNLVEVPDLRGLAVAEGRDEIASAGLVLGALDSLSHPIVAQGVILGQAPLPGQLAVPGTEVHITSSLGPQLRAVPDLLGVEGARARTVLETSGFVVVIDSTDADVLRGRVVSTTPAAASMVALPAEIRLMVSRGPPLVAMPALLGLSEAEALTVLDSLGLEPGEITEVFRFGRDQGIIVEQEPPAETQLQRGSIVRLSVGRRGG
jgi:serine/threonine-protein kinase